MQKKLSPPAIDQIEFMKKRNGLQEGEEGEEEEEEGALPEHSAHLLCISVPIQTFNMLK